MEATPGQGIMEPLAAMPEQAVPGELPCVVTAVIFAPPFLRPPNRVAGVYGGVGYV
jgi:hypothetical protein